MDVHHPIRVGFHQHCRHDFHVSSEQHELDAMLLEHLEKLPIVGFTTIRPPGKRFRIDEDIFEAMLSRPFQGQCIDPIADHRHDACIDLLRFNRIDNRLEI